MPSPLHVVHKLTQLLALQKPSLLPRYTYQRLCSIFYAGLSKSNTTWKPHLMEGQARLQPQEVQSTTQR